MNLQFTFVLMLGFGLAGLIIAVPQSMSSGLIERVSPKKFHTKNSIKFSNNVFSTVRKFIFSLQGKSGKDNRQLFELAEILDLLVVGLRAGDGIYQCLTSVIPRCDGEVAQEFTSVIRAVEFGGSLPDELRSVQLRQPQVLEFSYKLAASVERGTPLAQQLSEQSQSTRMEIRNRLLKQAGKNETRMLIPLVFLILPVTVLFAIYPSLKLLNFGFI